MASATNFRALYDYSPIHYSQARGNRGSSSTSNFHPVHPPAARDTPRHIVEDSNLGPALLNFARTYLQNNTVVPSTLLHSMLPQLTYVANITVSSAKFYVHNFFFEVSKYAYTFVQEADALPLGSVATMSCPTRHGVRPDGRSVRQNETRVILEFKGRRALDAHAGGITDLATANNERGTQLIRYPNETGSRSIIFKLGSYMAMENCPWAILFGMDYFMIFFLNKLHDGDDIYHHIHCSPQLPGFHNGQQQNPNVIQALIAMLLGGPSQALAQAFTPAVTVPIGQKYSVVKSGKGPKNSKQISNSKSAGPATKKTNAPSSGMGPPVQSLKSITLSSPASDSPERSISLNRFTTASTANCKSLRHHLWRPRSELEHHEQSAHIFLGEEIGYGVTGSVAKAVIQWEDSEQHVVVKLMEKGMSTFYSEAGSYNRLQGKLFCPSFYGAFVGNDASGAYFGAIVLEELPQVFKHEDDMTMQQRSQAFQCVVQLHDMGIHHGDIDSPCFGRNNSGQVVIYDFSHSHVFEHCDVNDCLEIKAVRRLLLGE